MLPSCNCCARSLFLSAFLSIIPKHFFPSTLIFAEGACSDPVALSSKMRWWKMAGASAPHCGPTPTCLTAALRAAISPSLSTKSSLETYFRTNSLPSGWVAFFQGLLLGRHTLCHLDMHTSRTLPECLR